MLMGKMEYCCLDSVQASPLRHPASSSGAQSASSSLWLLVLIPQLPSLHPSATRVQVLPESHLSCLFSMSGISGALTGSVLDALLGPLNILVTVPLPLPVVMVASACAFLRSATVMAIALYAGYQAGRAATLCSCSD